MYQDKVATLPAEVIPHMTIREMDSEGNWILLPPCETIGDIGIQIADMPGCLNSPDYAIIGEWKTINGGAETEFYITAQGTYTMYITGVDKGVNHTLRTIGQPKWKGYWEDNKHGYLFQIIKND